jgi:serine/threonine-protein kinase
MTESKKRIPSRGPVGNLYGYELVEILGKGAGSTIYAARSPNGQHLHALKHVAAKTSREQRYLDQLVNEFEVGTKLDHPRLRKYVELKKIKRLLRRVTDAVLLMEMVDGRSCEIAPPTTIGSIIKVFHQTCEALRAMHCQGFVHCDVSPNNVLVSDTGKVTLIDLGEACPIGSVKTRIQGTPDFISPEQVRRGPVTPQTDVFGIGATFYWLLSGRKLPTLYTLKKSQNSFLLADAVPTPENLNPKVPQPLSNLVMECVRMAPSRRPPSMAELCRRLETIQFGCNRASET